MLSKFEEVFNCPYYTSGNQRLFKTKKPDGWFEYNNNLFIIENKSSLKRKTEAYHQITEYYNIVKETEEFKKYKKCYLIIGCGTRVLKYFIYSTSNDEIELTKKTLEDLKTSEVEKVFDSNIIQEFNKYLYDEGINIPGNQKTFFVSIILLCLKANPRLKEFLDEKDEGFIIADYMIKLVKEYYKDNIFSQSFSFIKNNLNNNQLYHLINMLSLDLEIYGIDILNKFYSEFMNYDKKGEPNLGIVLTPHDIVELMVKELNIKKGESLMDCCTGTGSFLIEGSKYTDKLIGCENGEERYSLSKCNFILNDLDYSSLFFNNCFNQTFEKYDHIILNPPFSCNSTDNGKTPNIYKWRSFKKEQKFCLYQLQYLKENGTGCWIIPRSNFNNSVKKTNEFKKILIDNCQIMKIISCNSNVFKPYANVGCTIIVFKKCKINEDYETEIVDYSIDGYTVKKKIRVKNGEPKPKSYKINLKFNYDWNYSDNSNNIIINNFKDIVSRYNIEKNYVENKKKLKSKIYNFEFIEYIKYREPKEWKKFKISELFDLLPPGKIDGNKGNTEEGEYYLISTGQHNNGIIKNVSIYEYDGENNQYLTVAMYGTAGSTFYQKCKFIVNHNVRVLKPKKDLKEEELDILAPIINYSLTNKYSYSNGLSISKLLNEIIYYPIFSDI